jgi:hypothetical protein
MEAMKERERTRTINGSLIRQINDQHHEGHGRKDTNTRNPGESSV